MVTYLFSKNILAQVLFLLVALVLNISNVWGKSEEELSKQTDVPFGLLTSSYVPLESKISIKNINYADVSSRHTLNVFMHTYQGAAGDTNVKIFKKQGLDYNAINLFQQQNVGDVRATALAIELNNLVENSRKTKNRTITAVIGLGLSVFGSILVYSALASAVTSSYGTTTTTTTTPSLGLLGFGSFFIMGGSITMWVGVISSVSTSIRAHEAAKHIRDLMEKGRQ